MFAFRLSSQRRRTYPWTTTVHTFSVDRASRLLYLPVSFHLSPAPLFWFGFDGCLRHRSRLAARDTVGLNPICQVVFQMVAADTTKSVPSSPVLGPLGNGHHTAVLERLLVRERERTKQTMQLSARLRRETVNLYLIDDYCCCSHLKKCVDDSNFSSSAWSRHVHLCLRLVSTAGHFLHGCRD